MASRLDVDKFKSKLKTNARHMWKITWAEDYDDVKAITPEEVEMDVDESFEPTPVGVDPVTGKPRVFSVDTEPKSRSRIVKDEAEVVLFERDEGTSAHPTENGKATRVFDEKTFEAVDVSPTTETAEGSAVYNGDVDLLFRAPGRGSSMYKGLFLLPMCKRWAPWLQYLSVAVVLVLCLLLFVGVVLITMKILTVTK